MDFQPTEDQKALREGIRSFLDDRVAFDRVPELEKSGGFDADLGAPGDGGGSAKYDGEDGRVTDVLVEELDALILP